MLLLWSVHQVIFIWQFDRSVRHVYEFLGLRKRYLKPSALLRCNNCYYVVREWMLGWYAHAHKEANLSHPYSGRKLDRNYVCVQFGYLVRRVANLIQNFGGLESDR